MDLLRFLTAGSVDDGKSTLIGRLLYDSKSILIDHLESLRTQSKNVKNGEIDLALLTDGLRAEREQGITIDVAYKYFSTPKRKFIIADVPGHIQYTRNMVTGASNTDLIIILIDARKGVIEQTRRHTLIASLLKIPQVVVAINKMDLVDYDQNQFNEIKEEFKKLSESLGFAGINYIPISALNGDNIVIPSLKLAWYKGTSLLEFLENVQLDNNLEKDVSRFPVQYIIRPQTIEYHDFRGYAGKVISGIYKKGDSIVVLPSEKTSRISSIEQHGKEVEEVHSGEPAVILLEDNLDISRGDLICKIGEQPLLSNQFESLVCWMDEKKMKVGDRYILQVNSKRIKAKVKDIQFGIDVNTYNHNKELKEVGLNEIVSIQLQTQQPLAMDTYSALKVNGQGILIDENTFNTVGACLFTKTLKP